MGSARPGDGELLAEDRSLDLVYPCSSNGIEPVCRSLMSTDATSLNRCYQLDADRVWSHSRTGKMIQNTEHKCLALKLSPS